MATKLSLRNRISDALDVFRNGKQEVSKTKGLMSSLLTQGYNQNYSHLGRMHLNDIYQPREKLSFKRRDQLYVDSAILRTVIDKLTKEINRNGVELKSTFVKKCTKDYIEPCPNLSHKMLQSTKGTSYIEDCKMCLTTTTPERTKFIPMGQDECGEEYMTDIPRCAECGFPTRKPDNTQKIKLRKVMRGRVNQYNQLMSQIFFQLGLDLEKHDNAFLVTEFIYTFMDDAYKPTTKTLQAIYRGNPGIIRPVVSTESGTLGSNYYTCVRHRDVYEQYDLSEMKHNGIPRCDRQDEFNGVTSYCYAPLQIVHYVQIQDEQSEGSILYSYVEGEVMHIKKYSPSTAMGISMVDSLYFMVLQLVGQEKWIAEYYLKMRMFKGYLDVPRGIAGDAEDLVNKFSSEFKKFREDNWYMPIFTRPKDTDSIKYQRIDDSPRELQYIENRRETRTQIANAFGVSSVWMDDTSSGGGMNNEGMSMVVTNRAVKFGQKIFEEQCMIPLAASVLNVVVQDVEYYIGYTHHEEQDLSAEKQRKQLDIANARAHQELGGIVTMDPEGNYILSSQTPGMPLVPRQDQITHFNSGVQGMSEDGLQYERRAASLPMTGSPALGNASGGNLVQKIENKLAWDRIKPFFKMDATEFTNYYEFTNKYCDWEWKDKYNFVKFVDITISDINVHPDFEIQDEDVYNGSPRVRKDTLYYYITETKMMDPLIVDQHYNLLDGHHRLYALNIMEQFHVKVAVVKPKDVEFDNLDIYEIFKMRGRIQKRDYKRDQGGKFSTVEGRGGKPDNKQDRTQTETEDKKKVPQQEREDENEEEEGMKPKTSQENVETGKRYYAAQDGYKEGKFSSTVNHRGESSEMNLDLLKDVFPELHSRLGRIQPPIAESFNSQDEFNQAQEQYHNASYGSFIEAGKAMASKVKSDFVIPSDFNGDLWFAGNLNDLADILQNKEIGMDKLFSTPEQEVAIRHGDVLVKYKKGEGELFIDPDPFSEDGYVDEQGGIQYIKMFSVPLEQINEIWIKQDVLDEDMKNQFSDKMRGEFVVVSPDDLL